MTIERDYSDKDLRAALGSSPPLEKMKMDRVHIRELAKKDLEVLKWRKALNSLTPGGSEYVGDPDLCVQFVRKVREDQHGLILKQARDNTANLALITELVGALEEAVDFWQEHYPEHANGESCDPDDRLCRECEPAGCIARKINLSRAVLARAKASHGAGT